MTPLTMEQIARENDGDATSVTSLQLTHRALSDVSYLAVSFPNFTSHSQPLHSMVLKIHLIKFTLYIFSFVLMNIQVSCLNNLAKLERVDLSFNCLSSLEVSSHSLSEFLNCLVLFKKQGCLCGVQLAIPKLTKSFKNSTFEVWNHRIGFEPWDAKMLEIILHLLW
jgi:hypothetical protein